MKVKKYLSLLILLILLVIMAIFSNNVGCHDCFEYITITKNMAGFQNVALFSTHSIFYPYLVSFPLKLFPSILTIKIINSLWIFFIGLLIYFGFENKKAFYLFSFSPIVWFVSVQTTPILPATFFLVVSIFFMLKKNMKYNQIMSGLFIGLSIASYTPMIIVSFFYTLTHYWNKKLSSTCIFILSIILGLLPRLLLDYIYFNMPIYSFIRYFGANAIVSLGLHPDTPAINAFSLKSLLVFIIISPMLFKLYELDFKRYKKEIFYLIVVFFIFYLRVNGIKYFLILAPFLLILLSKILSSKEVVYHCLISLIISIFLVSGNFNSQDQFIQKDLKEIVLDYDPKIIVAEPYAATNFATFLWNDSPKIAWYEDFLASKENRTHLREYSFELKPKNIELNSVLEISANFKRFDAQTYENYIVVSIGDSIESENLKLDKCYSVLCVYLEK